jgi:hypothetical protein
VKCRFERCLFEDIATVVSSLEVNDLINSYHAALNSRKIKKEGFLQIISNL